MSVLINFFHVASGPWDGPSAAVEYIATYTRKKDNQRFYGPGGGLLSGTRWKDQKGAVLHVDR